MAELPLVYLYDEWKAEGLPVVVGNPTWQTYGRPYSFSVRGSIAHHTASPLTSSKEANRHVVINGNSVAPGPISHGLLQRDLTLEVIAAGRCNHGGAGWWPLGQDTANMYGFAIEAVNNGVGETWLSEFTEIMARAYAVVHRHHKIPANLSWCHSAYAPARKIDPYGPALVNQWSMAKWTNAQWQAYLQAAIDKQNLPLPLPLPPGDEMPQLRRVENTAAVLCVSGTMCTWVPDGATVTRILAAGLAENMLGSAAVSYDPKDIRFADVPLLTVIGPVPTEAQQSSVHPRGWTIPATYFRAHVQ